MAQTGTQRQIKAAGQKGKGKPAFSPEDFAVLFCHHCFFLDFGISKRVRILKTAHCKKGLPEREAIEHLFQRANPNTQCAVSFYSSDSMDLMILAGTPATITLGGTSLVTTAPAATMELSPMVTPGRMVAWEPIHTLFPK